MWHVINLVLNNFLSVDYIVFITWEFHVFFMIRDFGKGGDQGSIICIVIQCYLAKKTKAKKQKQKIETIQCHNNWEE